MPNMFSLNFDHDPSEDQSHHRQHFAEGKIPGYFDEHDSTEDQDQGMPTPAKIPGFFDAPVVPQCVPPGPPERVPFEPIDIDAPLPPWTASALALPEIATFSSAANPYERPYTQRRVSPAPNTAAPAPRAAPPAFPRLVLAAPRSRIRKPKLQGNRARTPITAKQALATPPPMLPAPPASKAFTVKTGKATIKAGRKTVTAMASNSNSNPSGKRKAIQLPTPAPAAKKAKVCVPARGLLAVLGCGAAK